MTIELTPDDALELRLLLAALRLEIELESKHKGYRTQDEDRPGLRERELRRGIEALERLLNGIAK